MGHEDWERSQDRGFEDYRRRSVHCKNMSASPFPAPAAGASFVSRGPTLGSGAHHLPVALLSICVSRSLWTQSEAINHAPFRLEVKSHRAGSALQASVEGHHKSLTSFPAAII